MMIAVACVFWIVAAWQLIHRQITRLRYARWIGLLSWGTILLAAGAFCFFISLGGNGWRTAPAGCFVLVLRFLLRRQMPHLAFWFPAPPAPSPRVLQRLNAPRKWEPLLWAFIYMGVWMFILGIQD